MNQTISTAVGETITIENEERYSAGYLCKPEYDTKALTLLISSDSSNISSEPPPKMTAEDLGSLHIGSFSKKNYYFTVHTPGKHIIKFVHHRPWEKDNSNDFYNLVEIAAS